MSSAALSEVATVIPIAPSFGAEIFNADLREPGWADQLRNLLDCHRVLAFRDQHLSRSEHVAVAKYLGEPTPGHPLTTGDPINPEILELDGSKDGKNARWHTDVTFELRPYAATILVPDRIPQAGGDTLWCDARGAYESLAAPLRDLVDKLEAVHRISPIAYWGEPYDATLSIDAAKKLLEQAGSVSPVVHPVVRVHPRAGRPNLFVNPGYTSHIIGLARHESEALLRLLYDHMTQPEHTLRHHWKPGDVVMWDNQATMHYAAADYDNMNRHMRRVTIQGQVPIGTSGITSRLISDPREGTR